jgi:CNT family concentrative nucleoside transporter
VATEFVAYVELARLVEQDAISPRTTAIATYALCGFANFPSIAIQIGGLGAMAPERRGDLARLGLRAMSAGALACWMTGAVAGVFLR